MKTEQFRLKCQVWLLSGFGLMPVSLIAAVLQNGDLDGTPGVPSTPTSWTVSVASPDLTNPGGVADSVFTYADETPASPNGGTFVIVETSDADVEGFQQLVTGLTPGASYQISFFQAQVGLTRNTDPTTPLYTDAAQWSVTFSGASQLSPLEEFTGLGTQTWTPVTLVGFVAMTESEILDFTSVLPVGSSQGYLGIDGISIQQIPEPNAALFLGLGTLAVIMRRRVKN